MFWAALSMMIMSMTGKGDDTAFFRKYLDTLTKAIVEDVSGQARQERALAAVETSRKGFWKMRIDYNEIGRCLERLDRTYRVTREDYERCLTNLDTIWDTAVDSLVESRKQLAAATTPEELDAIRRRVARGL